MGKGMFDIIPKGIYEIIGFVIGVVSIGLIVYLIFF